MALQQSKSRKLSYIYIYTEVNIEQFLSRLLVLCQRNFILVVRSPDHYWRMSLQSPNLPVSAHYSIWLSTICRNSAQA